MTTLTGPPGWFRRRPAPDATPLPAPVVDPRTPASVLIAQAQAQGVADAREHVRDSWSFGDAAQDRSAEFDPTYVLSLRHLREAAVQSALERHTIASARVRYLSERSEEAGRFMRSARSMMDRIARTTARAREPMPDQPLAEPRGIDEIPDDDPVWEGETVALRLVWRLLIMLLLVAAQTPLHHLVFEHFLIDQVAPAAIWTLSAAMAVFLVAAPHLAALLVRAREATGTERRLPLVVIITALFWIAVVTLLAILCGAVLSLHRERLEPLHITPLTVVLMFAGGLVIAGAMAYMLGLSRRHPFQEAYALNRGRREVFEAQRQELIDRICPEHAGDEDQGTRPLVEAVRAAYAAAEEAYFTALTQTVGDPSFTEAVQHRRGLRREVVP
ncbi:hypothetical protein ABZ345_08630 [Lentzea sp. NPDC005914]|uniref:hypothetical protein n=1 Tax=Lentzea sp. NPDC005914 TaxID=3154572 RepID=UPI0033C057C4